MPASAAMMLGSMSTSATVSLANAAKSGNVLVLLNTLYMSGFATMSPTIPLLTSKTMHALYATSFLIYSTASLWSWVHTYCILNGYETAFPLRIWYAVALVMVSVTSTMLTALLVMLCVENAFAHRLDITPYRTGFAVIWEALVEWVHSFNNFRVAFLFMALHDAPTTLSNYFLLPACRCASDAEQLLYWPLIGSIAMTLLSLLWRMVMLYFAYRRLMFQAPSESSGRDSRSARKGKRRFLRLRSTTATATTTTFAAGEAGRVPNDASNEVEQPRQGGGQAVLGGLSSESAGSNGGNPSSILSVTQPQKPSTQQHNSSFRSHYSLASSALSSSARAELPRLDEVDERWPLRWAKARVYGSAGQNSLLRAEQELLERRYIARSSDSPAERGPGYYVSLAYLVSSRWAARWARRLAYYALIVAGYIGCALACCIPCWHFYTCKQNSFANRHRCAKSCVRRCTLVFHYCMLVGSLVVGVVLIALNLLLLGSVHAVGSGEIPPEISRICLSIDSSQRTIQPVLRPSPPFPWSAASTWSSPQPSTLGSESFHPHKEPPVEGLLPSDALLYADWVVVCKPLWEEGPEEVNDVLAGHSSPTASNGQHRLWGPLEWSAYGAGWNRRRRAPSGPWESRFTLPTPPGGTVKNRGATVLLAVTTQLVSNFTDRAAPTHTLLYDFSTVTTTVDGAFVASERGDPNASAMKKDRTPSKSPTKGRTCVDNDETMSPSGQEAGIWRFIETIDSPPYPYFAACEASLIMVERRRGMVVGCAQPG